MNTRADFADEIKRQLDARPSTLRRLLAYATIYLESRWDYLVWICVCALVARILLREING